MSEPSQTPAWHQDKGRRMMWICSAAILAYIGARSFNGVYRIIEPGSLIVIVALQIPVWLWVFRDGMRMVAGAAIVMFADLTMQPLLYSGGSLRGFELLFSFVAGVSGLAYLIYKTVEKIDSK